MKKALFILMAFGGVANAACVGPYCYDDNGARVATGIGLVGVPLGTLKTTSPAYTGQIVYCSDCVSTPLCISTGTAVMQFAAVAVSTSATSGLGTCK